MFLEALWRYQFTQHTSPLTPELSQTLYDETQGITDLAVKVYMLAQIRAMTTGRERVTPALIRSVAADSLRLAQPMLRALRSGDRMQLAQFEDIQPLDIAPYLHTASVETVNASLLSLPNQAETRMGTAASNPPRQVLREGLLALETTPDQSLYETLRQAGYTRPVAAYLEETSS
jgi:hypothetical protein